METYKMFLVPMGNNKITEELELQECNYSVTPNIKGGGSRGYLDDEEPTKDLESPRDNK